MGRLGVYLYVMCVILVLVFVLVKAGALPTACSHRIVVTRGTTRHGDNAVTYAVAVFHKTAPE